MANSDVLILGGGLIGCATAWELSRAGFKVTVLERGQPGAEASTAAAGMLAPSAEIVHGAETIELSLASKQLYPSFISAIEQESDLEVGFRREGTLLLALDSEEARHLDEFTALAKEKGLEHVTLGAADVRALEPNVSERIEKAIYLTSDTQLDPRQLMPALLRALERRGVEIQSDVVAVAVAVEAGRVVGVRTPAGLRAGAIVINAAGAWAGEIRGCEGYAPMRPIRGQIVALRADPTCLRHVLRHERGYLVPRSDGRILAGSTMEDVGYDRRVTLEGVSGLLNMARALIPVLNGAEFVEAWAGLRPDTPDHKPILGATDVDGLYLATGHYRNGILLAPITARLMRELIVDGRPSLPLEEFSPLRFSASPPRP